MDVDLDCAEGQLNRLIEDRAASVMAENERAAWADHHRRMIGVHESLAQRHRDELCRLIDGKD